MNLPGLSERHPAALLRPAVGLLRELPVHVDRALQTGTGPTVVLMPAYGRKGAALLRIYKMADALKALGWQAVILPWRLRLAQRHRLLAAVSPDVVIMQGARHALNRPSLFPSYRVIFDIDDADFHLPHLVRPVRTAMSGVTGVMAGSRYIADWCNAAGARNVEVVWTGAPVSDTKPVPHRDRPPVIAWAQTRPMTYTREAQWVRDLTARLGQRHPGLTLRLFDRQPGDDPGFAASFEAGGVHVDWRPGLTYSSYLRALGDVSLGLAPLSPETPFSRGKSFGKILAYLDQHVPVLATAAGEPVEFFTSETGFLSNSPDAWCEEALRLIGAPEAREKMAVAAFQDFRSRLSTAASAEAVDQVLRRALVRDP